MNDPYSYKYCISSSEKKTWTGQNPNCCNAVAVLYQLSCQAFLSILPGSSAHNCEDQLHWNGFNMQLKYMNFVCSSHQKKLSLNYYFCFYFATIVNTGGPNLWEPHSISSLTSIRVQHVASGPSSCHSIIICEGGTAMSFGNCTSRNLMSCAVGISLRNGEISLYHV